MSQLETVADAYKNACMHYQEPENFVELFQSHYAEDAHFRDPVFEGYGYDGVLKYCRKICRIVRDLRIDRWETVHEDNKVVMHWDVTIHPKYWPFKVSIPGMTLLIFADEGRCVEHIEYWDLFNALINVVPIVPALFKLAPRRWREHTVFLK